MALDDFNEPSYFQKLEGEATNAPKFGSKLIKAMLPKLICVYIATQVGAMVSTELKIKIGKQDRTQIENSLRGYPITSIVTKPGREVVYKLYNM